MTYIFDHWGLVPGNPLEAESVSGKIVAEIRKRKGLAVDVPYKDYVESA